MRLHTFKLILHISALLLFSVALSNCNAVPEAAWEKTNNELIKQHQLKKRTIAGLPASIVESNIEPAKVASLDQLDSTVGSPGTELEFAL